MKRALLVTSLFLFITVVHAGLSFPPANDDGTVDLAYGVSGSFSGMVLTAADLELPLIEESVSFTEWSDVAPGDCVNVEPYISFEDYLLNVPEELRGLILTLFGYPQTLIVPDDPEPDYDWVNENAVPEPASCLLLGAGFLMLCRRR